MRWILLALLIFSLVGCMNAPIRSKSMGPDTYQVTRRSELGPKLTKKQAYDHAEAHAKQEDKGVVTVAEEMTLDDDLRGHHDYHTFTLTYRLVDADDPALQEKTEASPTEVAMPTPITTDDDLYTKLMKLQAMREEGLLTDEEFQRVKAEVLKK